MTPSLRSVLFSLALVQWISFAESASGQTSIGIFEGQNDVGETKHAGSAVFDAAAKTYTVAGGGQNMWFTNDAFHFVWKKISGNATLAADISFLGKGVDPHRKACLIIRQNLNSDSAYADAALHGDGLTSLQYREIQGARTYEIQSGVVAPKRLRLEKRGQYVSISVAGEDRVLRPAGGSFRLSLQEPYYIGLAVCSHNNDVLEKAVFSNLELRAEPPATAGRLLLSTLETVPLGSKDRRVVFTTTDLIESPVWTPDGTALLYKNKGRSHRIPAVGGAPVTADASGPKTSEDGRELSPDGKFVYFNSDRTGLMQIWKMRADGTGEEQVTSDGYNNWFAHPSPDGKWLVFISYEKEVRGHPANKDVTLRIMALEGGKIEVLAKLFGGQGTINLPSWSPDSKKVAFVSYQFLP